MVSDTDYNKQTYLNYLNIANTWDNYKGSGVTVAIIDTGIDTDHPEFSGKISRLSYNASTDTVVDGYNDWSLIEDTQGHGTAVAGVIASSMDGVGTVGLSPNVTLLVIKCEADEQGRFYNSSDLIFGLYYAIEKDVDVVNMSFGGGVDVVAPGTVYTTKVGGGYQIMKGTSFSSPIVASLIALYKQQNRYAEYSYVKELLHASTVDLGSLGPDFIYGYGAVDFSALLLEEKQTVTFNYLTDEIEETKQVFVKNHTLQDIPEPDRNYCVFDGWYYDIYCTEPLDLYRDKWNSDITLYARWANEDDSVPYTYVTLDDGTIEIRSYTGHRRYITIPDYIDGKVVSSIGENAFNNESKLRLVNLPRYLKIIKKNAFSDCYNLLSISIPSSVERIEERAFQNNNRLSGVVFEGNSCLTYIGDNAFSYTSLRSIIIPKKVEYVSGYAFLGTTLMQNYLVNKDNKNYTVSKGILLSKSGTKVIAYPAKRVGTYELPNIVKEIGGAAFAYSKLQQIDLKNVERINTYAFAFTKKLTSIYIPKQVETLGNYVFYNSGINVVNFDKEIKLEEISENAFDGSKLISVTIPNSVTLINHNAFRNIKTLKSVTWGNTNEFKLMSNVFYNTGIEGNLNIPENLVYIGEYSLNGLENLNSFSVDENNKYYKSIDGVLYSKDSKKLISFPGNKTGSYMVPNHVETIGFGAFENTKLSSVTFEENINLLTIGYRAFFNADNLKVVEVPSSVVSIDYYAFAYCDNLTTIKFKTNSRLTGIYEGAFYACKSLQDIVIPSSIKEISDYAFYECIKLNKLPLNDENEILGIYDYAFAYTGLTDLVIPDSVIDIGKYAFRGNKIKSLYIPNTNQETLVIELGAFQDCNELEDITLPFTGRAYYDDIVYFGYIFGAGRINATYDYVPTSLKNIVFDQREDVTITREYELYERYI